MNTLTFCPLLVLEQCPGHLRGSRGLALDNVGWDGPQLSVSCHGASITEYSISIPPHSGLRAPCESVYLRACVVARFLSKSSEVLGDLSGAELDVVDDSITGRVQATQHAVGPKILDSVAVLEVLERLRERLELCC